MKKISIGIAMFIFISWSIALLLNIDIYRKANIELNVIDPIYDAILLVGIGLTIFIIIANTKSKAALKRINYLLLTLGVSTILVISYFYAVTFH